MSLNIQSINSKFDSLTTFLSHLEANDVNFSAICLQETWLSSEQDVSIFNIPGYQLIHLGKSASTCGGLFIYLRDEYSFTVTGQYNQSDLWEGLFIEVQGECLEGKLTIGNIYRPPKCNNNNATIDRFTEEISPILTNIGKKSSNAIVAGDFNIDLLQINERYKYQKYFDVFVTNALFPLITLPTRVSKHSSTLIDQLFCKLKDVRKLNSSGIIKSNLSDHFPYFAVVDICKAVIHKPKFVTVNNNSESAFQSFSGEIATTLNNWNLNRSLFNDPNENYNTLQNIILQAKSKYLSPKTVRFKKYKHKISPWLTAGILQSIKCRDVLYRKLLSTPRTSVQYYSLELNLDTYKKLLKKTIRLAKAKYYVEQFEKNKSNIRHTWSTIKDILGKFKVKSELPNYFVIGDSEINNSYSIANHFNSFFANVGPRLSSNIDKSKNKTIHSYLKQRIACSFNFQCVESALVQKNLDDLTAKTSSGPDGISSKLLKRIKGVLVDPLTVIINQSLCTGIFPDNLKLAKVVPLFKKGNPHFLDNYRPISLLSTLSKIFEKVVFQQVYTYFTDNKLFYENQYGFRKNHSTELAAMELVDRISGYMDTGKIPISIFLDLSKAFDTLDSYILLEKLKHYGFGDIPLKWFHSYLLGRSQYVVFNGSQSDVMKLSTGVPQGSVLGPLLFIIYMNDIHVASKCFKAILYADDTNLISPICSFNTHHSLNQDNLGDICSNINAELDLIFEWLNINKLSLNASKTKYMLFHYPQRKVHNLSLELKINSTSIERVSEFNFLGLTLDECLSWKPHVQKISNKISRIIGVLCRLKNYLPKHILRTLYNSLILPHLQYSVLTWGFKMGRAELLQKRAVRVISCSKYNAHTDPLFKQLNLLKVKDIFDLNALKLFYKLKQNCLPVYVTDMFQDFSREHEHNTRQSLVLNNVFSSSRNGENCIRFYLPLLVNDSSQCVLEKVTTHCYQGFISYIKKRMIDRYVAQCYVRLCYICNRNWWNASDV